MTPLLSLGMAKATVDALATRALAHHQLGAARIARQFVGLDERIERGPQDGMLGWPAHLLAEDCFLLAEPAQALDELLDSSYGGLLSIPYRRRRSR